MTKFTKGQCLCGAVKFSGEAASHEVSVCHCGQCRRWASGPLMVVQFPNGVTYENDAGLAVFRSSDVGERGFCQLCGSTLFWREAGAGPTDDHAVSAGCLDAADLVLHGHIWIDDKPDWYDFAGNHIRKTAAECLGQARQD